MEQGIAASDCSKKASAGPGQEPTRVVVIGSSCAGKTTFSSQLAKVILAKHIELDALHWEPNWREAERDVFRARVSNALECDSWVVDGNYSNKVQDLVWEKANVIIWLDPPLCLILKRFIVRSILRSFKGELLWGHSRENLRNSIFSRNSLLIWILTTHKRRRATYRELFEKPQSEKKFLRLRTKGQIRDFLSQAQGQSKRES